MSQRHFYIKRNSSPEKLFLKFMLLLGLFFGYFEVTAFWNAGIILLTVGLLIVSRRIQKVVKNNLVPIVLLIILAGFIVLNIINTATGSYLT